MVLAFFMNDGPGKHKESQKQAWYLESSRIPCRVVWASAVVLLSWFPWWCIALYIYSPPVCSTAASIAYLHIPHVYNIFTRLYMMCGLLSSLDEHEILWLTRLPNCENVTCDAVSRNPWKSVRAHKLHLMVHKIMSFHSGFPNTLHLGTRQVLVHILGLYGSKNEC